MRFKTSALAVALVALTSTSALPQFDFGGGETTNKPWETFKLNPKTRIRLNYRNASVDSIIQLYQKQSGVTIVKDPSLTGTLSLTSAKPVSLKEAFQILSTTLSLKNYEMRKEGNLLVIRQRAREPQGGRGGFGGGAQPQIDPSMFEQPQAILKVYPIKHANASAVARTINDVFGQAGGGIQFPFGGGGQFRFGGQQNNIQNMMRAMGNRNQSQVRASSDDFSNSVIVNAPDSQQRQVADLISQIDKQTDQPQTAKVYPLQFASAAEIAPVIQNVLVSNAPTGRGGIGNQNIPFDQRIQQAFRFGSTTAAFGQVATDPRTNSLVVTATDQNHTIVQQVIKELDKEVQLESTTFVFPLANARADEVATLMNQAFGQRQGVGGAFGQNRNQFNRNNQNNRNNRNNRNFGGGGGNFGGGGGFGRGTDGQSNAEDDKFVQIDLEDPNAESGELMTSVGVVQGGPFQFFGGARQGQGQQRTTGRDSQGRIVNLADPTGQITVIPDPNTNSLIIVTTPENADMLRQVLEQLDRIPEQVMIETLIVEANLTDEEKFGIDWRYSSTKNGVTNTAGTNTGVPTGNLFDGFRYSLTGGNLSAYVNLFKSDNRFSILSTPRIFTSNNAEAQINISQSVPYVLSSREDITTGAVSYNYAFLDVGIILTVRPRITANGMVAMDVTQTANDLQGFTDFNAPIVNQRQADTTVSVKDGETIILGGIIRNTVTAETKKIPILGDIPILGNLFKSTTKSKGKTELLVFLTPRVVRDPAEAQKLRQQQQQQLSPNVQKEIQKQVPPLPEKQNGGSNSGDRG